MGHITVEQRCQIQALLAAQKNQSEIANIFGKDKSVISRELRQNRLSNGKYKAEMAQTFYRHRRKQSRKADKWNISGLKEYVEEQLREDKSPKQINGIMRKENCCLIASPIFLKKDFF